MNCSDKKIKNRPFNVSIYDRILKRWVLKLAWKSLQALKLSNSLTFLEFWIKCLNSLYFPWFFRLISNSLTFPSSPGLPGCVATLLEFFLQCASKMSLEFVYEIYRLKYKKKKKMVYFSSHTSENSSLNQLNIINILSFRGKKSPIS